MLVRKEIVALSAATLTATSLSVKLLVKIAMKLSLKAVSWSELRWQSETTSKRYIANWRPLEDSFEAQSTRCFKSSSLLFCFAKILDMMSPFLLSRVMF